MKTPKHLTGAAATLACVAALLPAAAAAQTSIARSALANDLNSLARQEIRRDDAAKSSMKALAEAKKAAQAQDWVFEGTVGLEGLKVRDGVRLLSTPVALGWVYTAPERAITVGLESDGWVRASSGGTSASGLADVVASIAAEQPLGPKVAGLLKLSAVLPTRGDIGSRTPSAGLEGRLRISASEHTTFVAIAGLSGNGDAIAQAGASTQSLTLLALHPLGPGTVVGMLSRQQPRLGDGATSWLVRWGAPIASKTAVSVGAGGERGSGRLFNKVGAGLEWTL